MEWDLNKIEQFYVSQENNPMEYNRLIAQDPVGRMWAGFRKAEKAFHEGKAEARAIQVGDFSIDPERSQELACGLQAAISTRLKCLMGMERAIAVLNGYTAFNEEPRTSYFQHWVDHLQRQNSDRHPEYGRQVSKLQGLISELNAIADSCFQ